MTRKWLGCLLLFAAGALYGQHPGVVAYRAHGTTIEELTPVRTDVPELPEALIIDAGEYVFAGHVYKLDKPGLYRFIKINGRNEQRIVHTGDVHSLLSAIAWLHVHGTADDMTAVHVLEAAARERKIVSSCGQIATMVVRILERYGVAARVVATLAAPPYNEYDNGHTLLEIHRPDLKRWVVYDIDGNAYFEREGQPLSLLELVRHIPTGDYSIVPIAADARLSDRETAGRFDYHFYMELIGGTEDSVRRWLKRVARVALIRERDKFYFSDDAMRSTVEGYAPTVYLYLPADEFMRRFYPAAQEQAKR